ncbi:RNA 3'-terminal phosphate cyclase [Sorangium cellulosum]|uniref:RNA 3'-terminal phosphate cyclase n=1 Tax=Sorangium cellulosum TaxID=56 RepID=A0A150QKW9_SORCE|nr:RNA 3'-terminal phosphate cyclase [Sorangium cellulosum]KYF68631.1 RNA 3'-phosphate cyclase [Sorangium cellulosum]
MLTIDGSVGEGGGQILRTTLSLSLITQTPVRITSIRKGRARPGLMRQHLTSVQAAAQIGRAEVSGAAIGSQEIVFRPSALVPGEHTFRIGSAGSTMLVLQTVLPALLRAPAPSTLTLEGGTHNPMAPPFDFLELAYLPLVRRMGPDITATLVTPGFYPAGGGLARVSVAPAPSLAPLTLLSRGEIRGRRAVATVSNLPRSVAMRELEAAAAVLGWEPACFTPSVLTGGHGPGNVLTIAVESEHVTEVFTGFGEKGVRAETVATKVAEEARDYIAAGVPVGEYLADQLLLLIALAGRGAFRTVRPSSHTTTHLQLLRDLLGIRASVEQVSEEAWHIEIER